MQRSEITTVTWTSASSLLNSKVARIPSSREEIRTRAKSRSYVKRVPRDYVPGLEIGSSSEPWQNLSQESPYDLTVNSPMFQETDEFKE